MKKGCFIGCLTVAGLAVLALVALVIVIDRAFGLLRPAERVDLAALYGDSHPLSSDLIPMLPI